MPHNLTKELVWINGFFIPSSAELLRSSAILGCEKTHEQDDVTAFISLLRACAKNKDLRTGAHIHEHLQSSGSLLHKCSNALVTMYAKCGALAKAKELLHMFKSRDVFTWTALIGGYAQSGQGQEAFALYEQMLHVGVTPIAVTYTCILKACGSIEAADKGKQIHDEIVKQGLLGSNMVVSNALVSMYVKCGALALARQILEDLPNRNVISWNVLIGGYTQHGEGAQALDCFEKMQKEGLSPDAVTFTCILTACARLGAVYVGEQIHDEVAKQGLLSTDITLGNALVDMYAKCGALPKARQVFRELPVRDVISWSTLIAGYAQGGQDKQALDCFDEMHHEGLSPNPVTFVIVLKACGSMGLIDKGRQIHDMVAKLGLLEENVVLGTAVLDMYVKCGALSKAHQVLEELPTRNVVSWSALIAGYVEHEEGEQALTSFERMQSEGFSPNAVTFTCILKACGSLRAAEIGEKIHYEIGKEGLLRDDIMLGTALVDMYAKCGALAKAQRVLEELPVRNTVTWNSLITGYVEQGEDRQALICYEEMKRDGLSPNAATFPSILKACGSLGALDEGEQIHKEIAQQNLLHSNVVLGNALVDMYVKCGALQKAHQLLDALPMRNVISWSALIAGYAQHGEGEQALHCFERMQQEGLSPDAVSFLCTLKACGSLGAADMGEKIHLEIARQVLLKDDVVLGTALVDMYAKCGVLTKARQVLEELSLRDTGCWNALIGGYVQHGECEQALYSFDLMLCENLFPDSTTFLAVLRACCRLGLEEDARVFLEMMSTKYGMTPELKHYTCMVDLYGRVGHLDKAMRLIERLPSSDEGVSSALLAACRKWGDVTVARAAFKEQECRF